MGEPKKVTVRITPDDGDPTEIEVYEHALPHVLAYFLIKEKDGDVVVVRDEKEERYELTTPMLFGDGRFLRKVEE
jgi:hypothetical protein